MAQSRGRNHRGWLEVHLAEPADTQAARLLRRTLSAIAATLGSRESFFTLATCRNGGFRRWGAQVAEAGPAVQSLVDQRTVWTQGIRADPYQHGVAVHGDDPLGHDPGAAAPGRGAPRPVERSAELLRP